MRTWIFDLKNGTNTYSLTTQISVPKGQVLLLDQTYNGSIAIYNSSLFVSDYFVDFTLVPYGLKKYYYNTNIQVGLEPILLTKNLIPRVAYIRKQYNKAGVYNLIVSSSILIIPQQKTVIISNCIIF